ncbi:MAG: hypothetical protein ACRDX8_02420 [Acidimicrobiales bacterium]
MTDQEQLRATGDRIEHLLDEIARLPDRRANDWAEELLRLVTDMYGACLDRIIETACRPGASAGPALLDGWAKDDLIASLLILHGLHPDGTKERVQRGLEELNPSLGAGDVRLLEIDPDAGTARIRALGDGTSGSQARVEAMVRKVIEDVAPEITDIELERPLPSTPVALGRRPQPASGELP